MVGGWQHWYLGRIDDPLKFEVCVEVGEVQMPY